MSSDNPRITNDDQVLKPVTNPTGRSLTFDFPGLEIGVGEYEEGPTGCTVFRFPFGSTGVADVRGGRPATILTHREGWVDAICLAGGAVYGLEATTGVSAELLKQKNYDTDWMNIGIVSGAVIFDFNQFRNNRAVYPDKALGRAALIAAQPGIFPMGPHGAGVCATVGKSLAKPYSLERAGQGGAVYARDEIRVAAFTVVNAVGCIVDRDGQVVRGHLHETDGKRYRVGDVRDYSNSPEPPQGNTTLTVVVINQQMDLRELRQLARQVHSSMARAIDPFHTIHDGDVLYAVTTNQLDPPPLKYHELSYLASEVAWDAVLSAF